MAKRKTQKQQDFQKVKFKVGKKIQKADNYTSTAFKSKAILVKKQLGKNDTVTQRSSSIAKRSKKPQEVLSQLAHYSPAIRLEALSNVKTMFSGEVEKKSLHLGAFIDRVMSTCCDKQHDVRSAALDCLKCMFAQLSGDGILAFLPTISAHLGCAMTHLNEDVKFDSLLILDLLLNSYTAVIYHKLHQLLYNFLDLISSRSEGGSRTLRINPSSKLASVKWRQHALDNLLRLLLLGVNSAKHSSTIDGSLQAMSLQEKTKCGIKDSYYQCFHQSTPFIYQALSVSDTDKDNVAFFEQLVVETIPLLRESWIEVCSDDQVTREALMTMHTIVNIAGHLTLLLNQSHTSDASQKKKVGKAYELMKFITKDFISSGFPYTASSKDYGKRRKSDSRTTEKTCVDLNIQLCTLAYKMGCCLSKTVSYLKSLLSSGEVDKDTFSSVLTYVREIGISNDMFQPLALYLRSSLQSRNLSRSCIRDLAQFVQCQLLSSSALNSKWTKALANIVLELADKPEDHRLATLVLDTVAQALARRRISLHPSQLDKLLEIHLKADITSINTKSLASVFYYTSCVNKVHLLKLRIFLWSKASPSVISTLLFSMLGRALSRKDSFTDLYLSFLCSLITGYSSDGPSSADITQLTASSRAASEVLLSFGDKTECSNIVMQYINMIMEKEVNIPLQCATLILQFARISKFTLPSSLLAPLIVDVLLDLHKDNYILDQEKAYQLMGALSSDGDELISACLLKKLERIDLEADFCALCCSLSSIIIGREYEMKIMALDSVILAIKAHPFYKASCESVKTLMQFMDVAKQRM